VGFEPVMSNAENLNDAANALTHELLLLLVNHIFLCVLYLASLMMSSTVP